jgi:hypothetical protein
LNASLRPLGHLGLIKKPVRCEQRLATLLEDGKESGIYVEAVLLRKVSDNPLGRRIEGAGHDDHSVGVIQGKRQRSVELLSKREVQSAAEECGRYIVNLSRRKGGDPTYVVENLSNDLAWGPVALQLDNDKGAIGVNPEQVDAAAEVGDDLPPNHKEFEAEQVRLLGYPTLDHAFIGKASRSNRRQGVAGELVEPRHAFSLAFRARL